MSVVVLTRFTVINYTIPTEHVTALNTHGIDKLLIFTIQAYTAIELDLYADHLRNGDFGFVL
jgi:hypothetical protein